MLDTVESKYMHEVLMNRYIFGHFIRNRDSAIKAHELGYYNDETGQATEVAQKYFDNLFEEQRRNLLRELTRLGSNPNKITYNQFSQRLDYPENTFYLHHFLKKLEREEKIRYREMDEFESVLVVRKK